MSCPNCSKFHNLCKAECCSIVPIDKEVLEQHKDKMQQPVVEVFDMEDGTIIPMTKNMRCVFLSEDRSCAIYDHRPEVCRLFGNETHLNLTCSYQKANGEQRSFHERKKIEKKQAAKQKEVLNNQK